MIIFSNKINQTMYPAVLCSRCADFLASKNRLLTYSIYYFVISGLPFVLAKTQQGVSNWTEYLKLVLSPT